MRPRQETHQSVAFPLLVGAPAYTRPPRIYKPAPRPPNLDDFPPEALQTDEEREYIRRVLAGERPSRVPSSIAQARAAAEWEAHDGQAPDNGQAHDGWHARLPRVRLVSRFWKRR